MNKAVEPGLAPSPRFHRIGPDYFLFENRYYSDPVHLNPEGWRAALYRSTGRVFQDFLDRPRQPELPLNETESSSLRTASGYAGGLTRYPSPVESIPFLEPERLMLFNSVQFLLFFAAFLPVYFLDPCRRTVAADLVGSYVFYMAWNVSTVGLLIALTVTAFGSAIAIEQSAAPRLRKVILTAGICAEARSFVYF